MLTLERQQHIRRKAKKVREAFGLVVCGAPDMPNLLERITERYPNFKIVKKLQSEMGFDEAWFDSVTETIFCSESVWSDAEAGRTRARFTLAHELGHFALSHPGAPRRNPNKVIYTSAADRIKEAEADLFASYLLAPSEQVINCPDLQSVQDRFQIGATSAEIAFQRAKDDIRRDNQEPRRLSKNIVDMIDRLNRN